jgi:azurin
MSILNIESRQARMNFSWGLLALSLAMVAGIGCTKKAESPESAPAASAPAATPAAAASPAAGQAALEVVLGSNGDQIAFDKTAFEVKAGSTVKVTFKNNATATSGMQHNLVIVKAGAEKEVSDQGVAAGADKGWAPENNSNVIAKTKLVNPGESDSITFVAPPAGSYPYICTFPGHSMTMKGVMTSK